MSNPAETKYVCVHGHFYQPPRENPWLEVIEKEDSASPYHDWNERINSECYRANTAARQVDDRNRILGLYNNFKSISFNFGPTLLRWMEQNDPWVYQMILATDRESAERHRGHGNGLAQVYNHIIMPLANRRDKITQVTWGLRDFEERFGRTPEGMWLAETAVDRETLAILADAGIKFTILSPFQADRWRTTERGAVWQDARDGTIPTGRAYRYDCGNGKIMHLFFYDAALAKGIAFERLLEHSSKLLDRIDGAHAQRQAGRNEPWLVHFATDGESYGHHFKFGDMALAAALQELERDPDTKLINYASFLASFPVRAEVEILENTAWSCSHGLGRWERDCGCHIGGGPGWTQQWRAPLREALNELRDTLAVHYEREMGQLCRAPWKARDDYIEVLLDSNRARDFAARYLRTGPASGATHRFFQLLEMQRCALYMFTSCGWFFDEIGGLETSVILRYAARAMQIAERTGAVSPEPAFLKTLEKAPSNLPEFENGADVYLKKVKPEVVRKDRVVANYAIQSLARSAARQHRLYCFDIIPQQEEDLGPSPAPCLFGRLSVKDNRTLEEESYLYAVIHFGGLDFRCSVKRNSDSREYDAILKALQGSVEEQNTVKMVRILDGCFGTAFFSLYDGFRDLRSAIALEIARKNLAIYSDIQRHLYDTHRPLMLSMRQWGIRIPSDMRVAVRRLLSDEVNHLVQELLAHEHQSVSEDQLWGETDFFYRAHAGRLHSILDDADSWGVALQLDEASARLGEALVGLLQEFTPLLSAKLIRLVKVCEDLNIKPDLWKLQTLYYQWVVKEVKGPRPFARIPNSERFLSELDGFLECRFSELQARLPAILPRGALVPVKAKSNS